uniref:Uncharacterized protein n=1 Tax=Solanum tuberosum TaxID=4113 RepID=M1DS38_SOLTU
MLETVNPRPYPTYSAQESEWAKAKVVLNYCNSVFERNRVDSGVCQVHEVEANLLISYDPELNKTLRRMNNQGVQNNPIREGLGDGVQFQPPAVVDVAAQILGDNLVGNQERV